MQASNCFKARVPGTCTNMYAAFCLLLLAACLPSAWLFERKALDDYVAQVDPHYNYTLLKTEKRLLSTVYSLNMTSQKWLDESEVDRPVWWHQMYIVLPGFQTMKDSCLLFISGGNNDVSSTGIDISLSIVIDLAISTGSCAVLLNQIPNQPITFHKAPLQECKNSIGYNLMGCSWWMFLNNKTAAPHSLMEFAMVKAVVRAMDTTTDFLLKESETKMNITKFALIGPSKRGFAVWLGAAVDGRVRSLIPVVSDLLNMVKSLHHEYQSLCGWSFGLKILHDVNITQQLDDPRFKEIASHIDPLEYNARYSNKTKFIMKTSGDEILLLDNTYVYWDKLKGKKHLLIIPNAGHLSIVLPTDILGPVKAFYVASMQNLTMPQVSWNRTETNTTGVIHLYTDQEPNWIMCYSATSVGSKRRDFRQTVPSGKFNHILWVPYFRCSVKKVKTGVYKAEMNKPSEGWRGFFIKATFPGPGHKKYVFTTEVHIIPNMYPCEDCKGEQCYGVVV